MINKLRLILSILMAKRVHIVEYDGFTLCKIGSGDKSDKGITKIKHNYGKKVENNG